MFTTTGNNLHATSCDSTTATHVDIHMISSRSHVDGSTGRAVSGSTECHRFTELLSSSVRVSEAMFKGIFYLAVLAVALVLYSDLAESKCTAKYCEDHDEADMWAVCLRNQEQLLEELRALTVKHERLQQEVAELKEEVVRKKSKYSLIVFYFVSFHRKNKRPN